MPLTRPLTALALACGLLMTLVTAPPSTAGSTEYGRTWRADGVLRQGCHDYSFRYRVRPGAVAPGNDWMAEFFLRDRAGRGLGRIVLDGDIDAKKGRRHFEICGWTTQPGRFVIRGKLSVYDGDAPVQEVWVKRTVFRLRAG